MKKIYANENRMLVWNTRNYLQSEGIECEVLNEYAAGGAGDLNVFDTWPEVWVKNESDYIRAKTLINQLKEQGEIANLQCHSCGEISPSTFELCWQCQKPLKSG